MARVQCSECEGTGKDMCMDCGGFGHNPYSGETCEKCNGTKKVKCTNCNGTGYVEISVADQMYNEASSYIEKENVTENDKRKAADLFAKAAGQGHMEAQYMLGLCYYHVIGVPQDDEKAAFWLRKAAAQGHENAKKQLKEMGVPLTAPSAEELFEKAYAADKAENQGEAIQCFKQVAKLIGADPSNLENLVEAFYQKGLALQKSGDALEALTFYKGAGFFGHKKAIKVIDTLASPKKGGFLGGLFGKK